MSTHTSDFGEAPGFSLCREGAWAQIHLEKGSLLLSLQDRAKEQQSSAATKPGLLLPLFQCYHRIWEIVLSDGVKLSRCAQDQRDACCRFGPTVRQQLLPSRGFIPTLGH